MQQKFLRYVAFEIDKPIAKTCHSHENILNASNMTNLEQRRTVADLTLFFPILRQFVDCSEILVFYRIYDPIIIRRWQLVRIATYRISLGNFVGNYNVINYNVGNCIAIDAAQLRA